MIKRIAFIREKSGLSQEKFAEKLGLSRNFINQVENGKKNVSDRTISDICKKIIIEGRTINEEWLRTGQGEMFVNLSRDEEIARFVGTILNTEEDSFQRDFISMLAKLNESDWKVLEKMALSIYSQKKD